MDILITTLVGLGFLSVSGLFIKPILSTVGVSKPDPMDTSIAALLGLFWPVWILIVIPRLVGFQVEKRLAHRRLPKAKAIYTRATLTTESMKASMSNPEAFIKDRHND